MSDPIREINASLAADPTYLPDHEPGGPRSPHPSHEWAADRRWEECVRCGLRDYWPGAEARCVRPTNGRTKIRVPEARDMLVLDLEQFFVWWVDRRDTPESLPSLDEWAANFFEWRKGRNRA